MSGHNNVTKKSRGWNVVEPKVYTDDAPESRVNLDPAEFEKLIKQKGVWMKVYRTTYCPNVKSIDGGEHNIDCTICNGSGWLDKYPLKVRAFIQSQNNDKTIQLNGYVDDNTVMVTFPIGIELQYFTLVELCDFTDIYMQRVARSATSVDHLKYKALRVNMIIDQNDVEYDEGTDFCLNEVGHILWKAGKGPASEVIYSIHYEAAVQFRAVQAIHVNRFTQVTVDTGQAHLKMPEQWMLKKEFLVKRKDSDGNEILPNPIPDYLEPTPE
mgnify:CR=1 FL=1|tara:strand:+ start:8185 stop:8991 length:807 start_codon:yes stop_codon:yes gene_type:complete